jgi:L-iditol 2-dehydrogenase
VFGYDLPGGMAQALAVPAEALACKAVVRLPDTLPVEFAPLAEPLHTVLNGQARARVGAGDSVLVLGLGAIGILHLAVARSRGASAILGVDPNEDRARSACEILGPDVGLLMDLNWAQRVLDLTDGQGWDVVVIANSAPLSLSNAMKLIGPSGRILAFAGASPDAPMFEVDLNLIHYRQVEIIGSFAGTPAYYRAAVDWLAERHLPLDLLVTARLPLKDAVEGFEKVERGEGLKTMLEP